MTPPTRAWVGVLCLQHWDAASPGVAGLARGPARPGGARRGAACRNLCAARARCPATTGDKRTAQDSHEFLLRWFDRFPQYRSNSFFLSGESYAGHCEPRPSMEHGGWCGTGAASGAQNCPARLHTCTRPSQTCPTLRLRLCGTAALAQAPTASGASTCRASSWVRHGVPCAAVGASWAAAALLGAAWECACTAACCRRRPPACATRQLLAPHGGRQCVDGSGDRQPRRGCLLVEPRHRLNRVPQRGARQLRLRVHRPTCRRGAPARPARPPARPPPQATR